MTFINVVKYALLARVIQKLNAFKTRAWSNTSSDVQLIREGQVNPETISSNAGESVDKRGKQQGYCLRRSRTGSFLPYTCWRRGQ